MPRLHYPADLTPVRAGKDELNRMWQAHGAYIFQSESPPSIKPTFYPIYRYQDLYSFSILPLILCKNSFVINESFVSRYLGTDSDVAGADMTIDCEIERLGEPAVLDQSIKNRDQFASELAEAMQKDAQQIFDLNPGKCHYVLCGGKDSLNILLMDWRAPVVALSAQPNFPLVKNFVKDNKLDIEVQELKDHEPAEGLAREIAEASCLVDLENWKWTEHLRRISEAHFGEVVFWKGQLADVSLTDYWRSYTSSSNKLYKNFRKGYRKLSRLSPTLMDYILFNHAISDLQKSIWERGAVAQGAHLGFLRSVCDALFVSAYHGPEAAEVMRKADLRRLSSADLRPGVGRCLLGRDVHYPSKNPAPSPSYFRTDKRTVAHFMEALESLGMDLNH